MAHYVMGDIHGEADRFHAMLKKIQFSEDDTLILLGDVIDRGPDGIALLLEIMEMPNVIMLLGGITTSPTALILLKVKIQLVRFLSFTFVFPAIYIFLSLEVRIFYDPDFVFLTFSNIRSNFEVKSR